MKRFYRDVSLAEAEGGYRVLLDQRPVRTQGRGMAQTVPNQAMAQMLATEWREQGETIDPARFVMRDLTDYAIDLVAPDTGSAIERLVAYAETDTLCYRAHPDEPFYPRQTEEWDPLLEKLATVCGIRLAAVCGIVHRQQDEAAMSAIREKLREQNSFALAAMETLAALAASLTIPILLQTKASNAEALWEAAELEERWQREQWGADEEAQYRADRRRAAFLDAARYLQACA